jgi:ribosomal protein S18 acetylase RimI-like enzyme
MADGLRLTQRIDLERVEVGLSVAGEVVAQGVAIRVCKDRDLEHFMRMGSPRHVQWCRDEFARGPAALAILVAVDADDDPIGKVHLDFEVRAVEGIAVLMAATVTPPLQRVGIGTQLMHAAEALACERGCYAIVLGVEDSNPDARRLYDRLGYEAFDVGDFPYTGAPTPNPGVWMRKDLKC